MDISSVNSDLIRGNVTTIILGSLWSQDRYGYDILKEIETKSEGQYKLKQPTLYNQLKRLEKQGLISSYDGDPDDTGGGRRRYYSLTAEGRNFLQKEKSEYEYSRTILDKLVSSQQFDFDKTPAPFNAEELRPYSKKEGGDKSKVVYKEKEVEKVVLVEKKVYLDAAGNEITEEEAARLAEEGQNRVSDAEQQAALAEARREESERYAEERRVELERLEEERRVEMERIEAERKEELERLKEQHREELEKLLEEKRASEEELARRQEEFEEERRIELQRLEDERVAAEEKFAAEQAAFREEQRAEEERRREAERTENERRCELERIEAERVAAEERFAREQAAFREEIRAEEERRALLEKQERERMEEEERIAREREEALRSQATMSLADVFKELDAQSEYAVKTESADKLIVEDAKWQVAPLPVEEKAEKEEEVVAEEIKSSDTTEPAAEEVKEEIDEVAEEKAEQQPVSAEKEEAAEEEIKEEEKQPVSATVSLKEIFERLDAKSEYDKAAGAENDAFVVDQAIWHVDDAKREEEERLRAEEQARIALIQAQLEEENRKREEERRAELKRLADELAAVKERLDAQENIPEAIAYTVPEGDAETKADIAATEETETVGQRDADTAQTVEVPENERIITSEIWTEYARLHEAEKEENRNEEINYFSAEREVDRRQTPQATLSEIFRKLDEKEAEIDAKNNEEVQAQTEETPYIQPEESTNFGEYDRPVDYEQTSMFADERSVPSEAEKGEFVTSAVLGKRTEAFDYEKGDVNYKEFFSSIAANNEEKPQPAVQEHELPKSETDLKTRLYAEGFKMRPYDRGNTSEYYTFNFIQSNRLNRDSWLIVLAIFLVEVAVMWASTATRITWIYFLPIMLGGAVLMLLPSVAYLFNPTKRKRADFNFKLSIINRGMIMIELAVVLVLIAFFAVGVSVKDETMILMTMGLPIILLTNLPVSSVVYYLLYRTKKYHTA